MSSAPPRVEPIISLRGVTKRLRQGNHDIAALDGVSLDIDEGTFVGIMGPSGSGKSTLLGLIGGIDTPTAGAILIGGRNVSDMTDDEVTIFRRRHVGIVFQFFNLLPMLSAEENVAMPLILDGESRAKARPRAVSMLERVGLRHRLEHRPDQLSGGEMQRVAIARALVIQPLVLLADEPTGNLDSKASHEILELIRTLSVEHCKTVIMVTHDLANARCSDRLVTLRDGRVVDDVELPSTAVLRVPS